MIAAALASLGLAVLIHFYIFVLESLRWSAPSTRKIFGIRSQVQLDATRPLAFNQGFYNLFLALIAVAGMVVFSLGYAAVGLDSWSPGPHRWCWPDSCCWFPHRACGERHWFSWRRPR